MDKINFMAIDPSKRSTGVFIKFGKEQFLYTIKFKQKVPDNELFMLFSEKIGSLMEKHKIELIFHEGIPLGISKKHTIPTKSLNEMLGLIKLQAYKNNIQHIIPVNQSLWKGILKGYPFLNTEKNKIYIEIAEKYLKRSFSSCDEVDAFCIGVAIYNLYKKYPFTDAQAKLRKKIILSCNEIKAHKLF